jgi:hypothetical protein
MMLTDEQRESIEHAATWLARSEDIANQNHAKRLRDFIAASAAPAEGREALDEFIRDVAQQKPEKPDYWSSCGQCERNADRAQDLLESCAKITTNISTKPDACPSCGSTGECKSTDPRMLGECQGAWYRTAALDTAPTMSEAAHSALVEAVMNYIGALDAWDGSAKAERYTKRKEVAMRAALAGIERAAAKGESDEQ